MPRGNIYIYIYIHTTVDDLNPALPTIRNIPYNSHGLASFTVMQDVYHKPYYGLRSPKTILTMFGWGDLIP